MRLELEAHVTPTKIGQFVTMYKRIGNSPIMPYDRSDNIDEVVVKVQTNEQSGQFVFPKDALVKHDIFSVNGKGGKRAIRVYPPWDKAINPQARKTQAWQLEYFYF